MEDEQGAVRQVIELYLAPLNSIRITLPLSSIWELSTITSGNMCRRRLFIVARLKLTRSYALAFFDLGNSLDELQRLDEAVEAYRTAIRLVPKYADAHYNLALAYERVGEHRRALPHWMTYASSIPWARGPATPAGRLAG